MQAFAVASDNKGFATLCKDESGWDASQTLGTLSERMCKILIWGRGNMRGIVLEIQNHDEQIVVKFATDIGTVFAPWVGNLPQIAREYFVELEVSDVLRWGMEITLATDNKDKIDMRHETSELWT